MQIRLAIFRFGDERPDVSTIVRNWFWHTLPEWDVDCRQFYVGELDPPPKNYGFQYGGDWARPEVEAWLVENPIDYEPTHFCVWGGRSPRSNCGMADAGAKRWCAAYDEQGCGNERVIVHEFVHLLISSEHAGTIDRGRFNATGDRTDILGGNTSGRLEVGLGPVNRDKAGLCKRLGLRESGTVKLVPADTDQRVINEDEYSIVRIKT